MQLSTFLETVKDGLIVSCQALEHEPLFGSSIMTAMALSAEEGGAVAIRANSPQDIKAIKQKIKVPLIGLHKVDYSGFEVYITPTIKEVLEILDAGADVIAIDATQRPHPDGLSLEKRINEIKHISDCPIMADISNFQEADFAIKAGADIISTTLSGYTKESPKINGPDFNLIQQIVQSLDKPVICEGKIWCPREARKALELGAHAVVVGSAITRPQLITRYFVETMNEPLSPCLIAA